MPSTAESPPQGRQETLLLSSAYVWNRSSPFGVNEPSFASRTANNSVEDADLEMPECPEDGEEGEEVIGSDTSGGIIEVATRKTRSETREKTKEGKREETSIRPPRVNKGKVIDLEWVQKVRKAAKAPNWDALTRKKTKQALIDHEYLSFDQNPGSGLDSFNAVWAKAHEDWVTDDWSDDDWEKMEQLWVHLLQNSMKEAKADRALTVRLANKTYITKWRWELDRATRGTSAEVGGIIDLLHNLCEADHVALLQAVFAKVGDTRVVAVEFGKAVQEGKLL